MSDFKKIKPNDIKIDPVYQRELEEARAIRIAENYNADRLGVPLLSHRGDGLYVLDGQHRVVALQLAGLGNKAIVCEVKTGLTIAEEARLFIDRNTGAKRVGALDLFRARVEAGEPEALAILSIIEDAGLRIGTATSTTTIRSIGAIQFAHRRHALADVLEVLVGWCNGDPAVFEGQVIKIMTYFLTEYPEAETEWLVKRLRTVPAGRLRDSVKRLRGSGNDITQREAACTILRQHYNKARRRGKLGRPQYMEAAE